MTWFPAFSLTCCVTRPRQHCNVRFYRAETLLYQAGRISLLCLAGRSQHLARLLQAPKQFPFNNLQEELGKGAPADLLKNLPGNNA